MKKFFISLLGLSLLVSISCSNTFNRLFRDTSISITLPFQGREAWLKNDITSYKIILTYDADENITQTQTATPEKPTVTFQELEPGTYSLQALAYNEETEIAGGQTKVTVEEGQNATATIKMTLYQTKNSDKTSDTVTITFNCNYEGGPAEVQWKDVNPEKEKVIQTYNTIFTSDDTFQYGAKNVTSEECYYFCGWSVGEPAEAPYDNYTILQVQDLYNFTEDTTLYAVWCNKTYFQNDTTNFVISYVLSKEYKYNVYFLNSHREQFVMTSPKYLFPELTLPNGIIAASWEASNTNELGNAYAGKTFKDVTIIGTAEFTYKFSPTSFAITIYGNTEKTSNGFHNVEIEDFLECKYKDGSFCYELPTTWDSFDNALTKPDDSFFTHWSMEGESVEYINLNNANNLVEVFANWNESAFLKNEYDLFYTITNLGEKQKDATAKYEYFNFTFSTLDTGKLKYTYTDRNSTMILQGEQSKYIIDDDIYELWYTLYLKNGGYPSDKFNDIRIDYVTNNGIIFTASVDGAYNKFYLATQDQYNAALDSQKLFIISENPSSSEEIDMALAAYNN